VIPAEGWWKPATRWPRTGFIDRSHLHRHFWCSLGFTTSGGSRLEPALRTGMADGCGARDEATSWERRALDLERDGDIDGRARNEWLHHAAEAGEPAAMAGLGRLLHVAGGRADTMNALAAFSNRVAESVKRGPGFAARRRQQMSTGCSISRCPPHVVT
jgi:hypothetical protein